MIVETVGEIEAQWGEGPIWVGDRLCFVDIEGQDVHRIDPSTGALETWPVGERVGCVVPRRSGGFVIAGDYGFSFLDPESGKKTSIIDPEPDKKPDNRFNDGKCDPAGRFWAGTISTVKKTGDASLYCLEPSLCVSVKIPGVTNSNGIGWSRDGMRMFYIDTPTKTVNSFDFDVESGSISNGRVLVDTSSLPGSPDGMALDADDNLWVAFCRGSSVVQFNGTTGKEIRRLEIPVTGVTACAFGGRDLRTLFVTTGRFPNVDEPLAGRLFAVELDVLGARPHEFAG